MDDIVKDRCRELLAKVKDAAASGNLNALAGEHDVGADEPAVVEVATGDDGSKTASVKLPSGVIVDDVDPDLASAEEIVPGQDGAVSGDRPDDQDGADAPGVPEHGEPESPYDNVNHPKRYTRGTVECIDAQESAMCGKPADEAHCVAEVIGYLWRYDLKEPVRSIESAEWYLKRLKAKVIKRTTEKEN